MAYIKTHRQSAAPFGVAVNAEVPADAHKAAEIIQAYQEAGATWWIALEGSMSQVYSAKRIEHYRVLDCSNW